MSIGGLSQETRQAVPGSGKISACAEKFDTLKRYYYWKRKKGVSPPRIYADRRKTMASRHCLTVIDPDQAVEILDRFQDELREATRKFFHLSDGLDDIIQSVFLWIIINRKSFVDESHLKAWAIQKARWLAVDCVRYGRRRRKTGIDPDTLAASRPLDGSYEDVFAMINKLPEPEKQIVELRFEGYTSAQIAAALKMKSGKFYRHWNRARLLLSRLAIEEVQYESE